MDTLTEKKGVVTFIDILGWKGIYYRKKDALQCLRSLIKNLQAQATELRGSTKNDIQITSISDTIVISCYCKAKETEQTIENHGKLSSWIIIESIKNEFLVRGATSYGEFEYEENIFLGKAVDEAASWYEKAEWVGIHLTPSAEFVFRQSEQESNWNLYKPVFKNSINWETHCVNWPLCLKDRPLEYMRSKFLEMGPITSDILPKISNTLTFIEQVKKTTKK